MKIMVVDVAAEHSGALTILNEYISRCKNDSCNDYFVILSIPKYEETENVSILNLKWVKKSYVHRLYFDKIYVRKLINQYKPDKLLSLQNNAFHVSNVTQEVYFHNILPLTDIKFSFHQSKKLWFYQNIIGNAVRRSLKNADYIIVQAEWIKKQLVQKWKIEDKIIKVEKPLVSLPSLVLNYNPKALFYPANGGVYKNHITLIKALLPIWGKYGKPELRLTVEKSNLPEECQRILEKGDYPITFLGRLNMDQMWKEYQNSILVFPSYIETVGLPLLEAKAVSGKIIASDLQYARDILDGYQNVEFFRPFDDSLLAKIIHRNCMLYRMI